MFGSSLRNFAAVPCVDFSLLPGFVSLEPQSEAFAQSAEASGLADRP